MSNPGGVRRGKKSSNPSIRLVDDRASGRGVAAGLVERWFFLVWSMCPLNIAVEWGGCFFSEAAFRPGKPVIYLLVMACLSVDKAGEQRQACWKATRSAGVAELCA